MDKKIYSQNADFQRLMVLKTNRYKRHKYRAFFVEGVRNINNAIAYGWHIQSLIYSGERVLSDWAVQTLASVRSDGNYALTNDLMEVLSGKADTSELLAIVSMRVDDLSRLVLPEKPLLALFDRPSNHGNLGTIIRSCDGLGVDGLILTGHAADLYDSEVIAATMGSFFKLPVIRVADNASLFGYIDRLREQHPGFQLVGTTAHKEVNVWEADFRCPAMILIGNETDGLCRAYKEACDVLVTIPMPQDSAASSFNVGCAATVLFYEARRQRMQEV